MSQSINKDIILKYLKDIYHTSRAAHRVLFSECEDTHETKYNKLTKEYKEERKELVAGIILGKAISATYSLKAFYYSSLSEIEDLRIDNILVAFDRFSAEFLTSLETKHSYQHTDIYFHELIDALSSLIKVEI